MFFPDGKIGIPPSSPDASSRESINPQIEVWDGHACLYILADPGGGITNGVTRRPARSLHSQLAGGRPSLWQPGITPFTRLVKLEFSSGVCGCDPECIRVRPGLHPPPPNPGIFDSSAGIGEVAQRNATCLKVTPAYQRGFFRFVFFSADRRRAEEGSLVTSNSPGAGRGIFGGADGVKKKKRSRSCRGLDMWRKEPPGTSCRC